MIKILHFSDLHLGMENYGHINPLTGLSSRIDDFLKTLDFIVDYALSSDIDFVLFAGDAYKTRFPSPTYLREFSRRIYKIAEKIPVVLLVGNHDSPAVSEKANTLDIFSTLNIKNVYVIRKPEILKIPLQGGKTIQVLGIPWLTRGELLKKANKKKISPERFEKIASLTLGKIVDDLKKKMADDLKSILVFHGSVEGGRFGAERSVFLGTDPIMPFSKILDKRFSYIGLGHLHSFQILSLNPPVVYSGSPERIDFSEEKEDKGFVVVKIGDKESSFHFIKTPARPFFSLKIDLSNLEKLSREELFLKIKEKTKNFDLENAVLKLILEGPKEILDKISEKEIRGFLGKIYFLVGIFKEIKTEKRKEIILDTSSLSPVSLIDEYLFEKNYPEAKRKIIKETFQKLLEEI